MKAFLLNENEVSERGQTLELSISLSRSSYGYPAIIRFLFSNQGYIKRREIDIEKGDRY